ncbi:MAG: aminopeptidase P family protein [Desulfobacteraceae bacterium]|nr:MAG: aminopeptidase P family protein [Desulfobacteraceae bacterium]
MTDKCTAFKVPLTELVSRKKRIQRELQAAGIPALLIIQRVDLFYFSGTSQNSFLFMPAEGEPLLMVRKYYPRAREESFLPNIVQINSIRDMNDFIYDFYGSVPAVMGLELDVLPVNSFLFYQQLFPGSRLMDGSGLILKVRSRKSAWEIDQMEKTAELTMKVFLYMKQIISPGMSEVELAVEAEAFARRHGHAGKLRVRDFQTEGYFWHVLGGKSGGMVGLLDAPASGMGTSPAFPCGAGFRAIGKGEPVMADLATALNGFHLDETRMLAMEWMPESARRASEAAIEIHNRLIERLAPGMRSDDLFDFSIKLARDLGYEENYLGPPGHKVQFVAHGIGHEMIEPPFIAAGRKDIFEPGMTLALEPKFLFPGEFTAGIESVVLVTEDGSRLISKAPVDIFIC